MISRIQEFYVENIIPVRVLTLRKLSALMRQVICYNKINVTFEWLRLYN